MHLSIQKIISQAIQSIRENFGFFVGITLIFFIFTALLDGIFIWVGTSNIFIIYLLALVNLAIYVKQAVVIHRSVILDEANRWDKVFSWGSADNQFLLISVGLWLLFSLAVGLFTALVMPFYIYGTRSGDFEQSIFFILVPIFLVAGIIFSRICLALPSRAIGNKMSIGKSIALTKKNSAKIFVLIVLLPIAINLLINRFLSEDKLVFNLFVGLIAHLIVVFQVSILSHTYITLYKSPGIEEQTKLNV